MHRVSTAAGASAVLLAIAFAMPASADIGPKPTMAFTFAPDKPGLGIVRGELLECGKADCADARRLKRLGPQGIDCSAMSCNARAYGFARYNRLRISFSDGRTLASNIFRPAGFNARYRVRVMRRALDVRPQ